MRSCGAAAERWRIGAEIVDCSERDRRAVIAYCNVVWPYMRLRGEIQGLPDQGDGARGRQSAESRTIRRWRERSA